MYWWGYLISKITGIDFAVIRYFFEGVLSDLMINACVFLGSTESRVLGTSVHQKSVGNTYVFCCLLILECPFSVSERN